MKRGKHPIVTTDVICADGSHRLGLRVYCEKRSQSVPLDDCRACTRCDEISGDSAGEESWVICEIVHGTDSVGSIVHGSIVCVRAEVSVASLKAILIQRELPFVFVVDDDGKLLGVVNESDLIRVNRMDNALRAVDVMSSANAIEEDEAVRRALVTMASHHARRTAVVTREGLLVGEVRDVEALAKLNAMKKSSAK